MKPITAIIVFFALMLPSLCLGYANFAAAKVNIIEDMNQALASTIRSGEVDRITADTLRTFRGNLRISRLKETSYLSLCTEEPSKVAFCSDTMTYKYGNERLYVRAYPNCSMAAVFGMSSQTMPALLFSLSVLWGLFSLICLRRKGEAEGRAGLACPTVAFGNLYFSEATGTFYNERWEEIRFTPMQSSLMKMLMGSEGKRLPVDEICRRLWPKKENARETLYTLVRRLKPIVEGNSNVRIVAGKGGCYALSVKD